MAYSIQLLSVFKLYGGSHLDLGVSQLRFKRWMIDQTKKTYKFRPNIAQNAGEN